MKKSIKIFLLLFASVLIFSVTSCREKTAAEKVEDGVEEVGDEVEDGAEEIKDEVEDAVDDN
jgi:uncharacterized lipoprotein YehR (DUF1307 family)